MIFTFHPACRLGGRVLSFLSRSGIVQGHYQEHRHGPQEGQTRQAGHRNHQEITRTGPRRCLASGAAVHRRIGSCARHPWSLTFGGDTPSDATRCGSIRILATRLSAASRRTASAVRILSNRRAGSRGWSRVMARRRSFQDVGQSVVPSAYPQYRGGGHPAGQVSRLVPPPACRASFRHPPKNDTIVSRAESGRCPAIRIPTRRPPPGSRQSPPCSADRAG